MAGEVAAPDLAGLPDEVRQEILKPQVARDGNLATLTTTLVEMREKAVKARKESGIEATWLECEELYLGIDDENRAEFAGAKWIKPQTIDGSLVRRSNSSDDVKATAFMRESARYVDAGKSKVCEIALPIDGKPFTLKATPLPEVSSAMGDDTPAEQITGQPMPGHDGQPVKVSDLAKSEHKKAEGAAEKAATRINDWLVECKHNAQMRKCVFDMARIGVAVLKGPTPVVRRAMVVRRDKAVPGQDLTPQAKAAGALIVEFLSEVKPATEWVDPWNFYPAPGCGEDITRGDHCFELIPSLASQLMELADKSDAGYMSDAIKAVVSEGPGKKDESGNSLNPMDRLQFGRWLFNGAVPLSQLRAANPDQAAKNFGEDSKDDDTAPKVNVIAELVNDRLIRMVMAPLDGGRIPYHVACWSRRAGHWAGIGVAEQTRTPARMLNAAVRRLLNNAALSSGAQVVMDPEALAPANKSMTVDADKLWFLRKDTGIDDVRKVFQTFQWPNTIEGLLKIIEFTLKMFEEHTSIPLITQGQSGKNTPDTFGGQQLQDNNANQLLRDVGFSLNDGITTPMLDQMYEWLLLDEDVPDDEKGDYQVDTSGALAIIEKALQDQSILAMAQMIPNAQFRIDPARWFAEWARSKRLVPSNFQYSDVEWEQLQKQPPPKAVQVQVAEVRAASAEKIAQGHDDLAAQRNQTDLDRDTRYNEVMAAREQAANERTMEELRLKHDLAVLEYMKDERISLQEAKTRLADTTLKLRTQVLLAGKDGKGPEVATPPDEPPGRAPDGEAFQA